MAPSATCTTQSAATTKKYFTVAFCDGVGLQSEERVAARHAFGSGAVVLRGEVPDHSADAGEQQDEADDAPHDRGASGTIADEFFMRPVLGVGDSFAGAFGAGGPGRPPEECCHLVLLDGIIQSTRRNGVGVAAVAVDVSVVGGEFVEGSGAIIVESDGVGGRIVGIMAGDLREPGLKGGALL